MLWRIVLGVLAAIVLIGVTVIMTLWLVYLLSLVAQSG